MTKVNMVSGEWISGLMGEVRTMEGQQPTNLQGMTKESLSLIPIMYREWTDNGPMMDRVKSRMTSTLPALTLLMMLTLGNVNAWGTNGSMNYTVYLQQGKGTVQAEVWTYRVGTDDTRDAVASTSTPGGSATASLNNDASKYWKFRVPDEGQNAGYTFDAWYSDEACSAKKKLSSDKTYGSRSLSAAREKTVYAKFTPNSYTIAYNNNGGSGSMSNTGATYDASVTLRTNTFTNANTYTITYNSNGGSAISNAAVGLSFNGWNTASNGSGDAYTNGQSGILNIATSGTATLYAQWLATTTLPTPTKAGFVFEGWYNGSVDVPANRVGGAGDTYHPTGNITLNAHWVDKLTPSVSGANHSMEVGDEQTSAFSFTNVDGPVAHISISSISEINNGNEKVIEYDAANNKIIAHNAGVATIYFTQAETSTLKPATSSTYTYTVTKKSNTLACSWGKWNKTVEFYSETGVR